MRFLELSEMNRVNFKKLTCRDNFLRQRDPKLFFNDFRSLLSLGLSGRTHANSEQVAIPPGTEWPNLIEPIDNVILVETLLNSLI